MLRQAVDVCLTTYSSESANNIFLDMYQAMIIIFLERSRRVPSGLGMFLRSRKDHAMNTLKPFAPRANSGASAGAQPPAGRARPWKVIAQEVSGEQDRAKLTKLVAELNQALDEQGVGGSPATMKGGS